MYTCKCCGKLYNWWTGDMVVLPDELWLSVCDNAKDVICAACIEARLGRKLCEADFPLVAKCYGMLGVCHAIPCNLEFFKVRGLI